MTWCLAFAFPAAGVGIDVPPATTFKEACIPGCSRHKKVYVPTGAVTLVQKWGSLPGVENCSPLFTTPVPSKVQGFPEVPHVGSLGPAAAGLTSIWLSDQN